ncbi:hypothetical protein D3C76_1196980 [compost metagenome]
MLAKQTKVRPAVRQGFTQGIVLHRQGQGSGPVVEGFTQIVNGHFLHREQHQRFSASRYLTTAYQPAARRLKVGLPARKAQACKGIERLTQQRMAQVQQHGVRGGAEYRATIDVVDKEVIVEHQPGHGAANTYAGGQTKAVIDHGLPTHR